MAKILVVDDNEEIRKFIRRILEIYGHSVVEAANGKDALRLVGAAAADLVITDVFMPDFDGLEMMRSLRRQQSRMKVIAISGGGNIGDLDILRAAEMLGAFRVLAKPFSAHDFLQAVNEALAASSVVPPEDQNRGV